VIHAVSCVLQHAGHGVRRWIHVAALCVLGITLAYPVSAQRIAITLDDLPYVPQSRTTPAEGLDLTRNVTAALGRHSITATGFAVGQQVSGETRPALEAFAAAGHQIGNHSWSHPDAGTLSKRQFRKETRKADRALSPWLTQPKYYRFPFLRRGGTAVKEEMNAKVLADFGYRNVPVSIDTDDWRFNAAYLDALDAGAIEDASRVAETYLAHIKERSVHFAALARTEFGRDVDHILLLHMNRINGDHLGTLLEWYAAQGWSFITVGTALSDPIYSAQSLYEGPKGISQIERIIGAPRP